MELELDVEIESIIEKGGATLKPTIRDYAILEDANLKTGYAVSLDKKGMTTYELNSIIIQAYVSTYARLLSNNPNAYVGLWFEKKTGLWYLDITLVYPSIYNALDTAHQENQKAIYSFQNQASLDAYTLKEV
jgi:hypothetical protein